MKTCILQNYRVKELSVRVKSGREASVCAREFHRCATGWEQPILQPQCYFKYIKYM